jgi:hypothetical protein
MAHLLLSNRKRHRSIHCEQAHHPSGAFQKSFKQESFDRTTSAASAEPASVQQGHSASGTSERLLPVEAMAAVSNGAIGAQASAVAAADVVQPQLLHDRHARRARASGAAEEVKGADHAALSAGQGSAAQGIHQITANTMCHVSAAWGSVEFRAADLVPLLAAASVCRQTGRKNDDASTRPPSKSYSIS